LSECGFDPVAVESGDEALKLLQNGHAIDLVFSDVRMPGTIDGFGLARWGMDHRPDLPVLLGSGDLGKVHSVRELTGAEILPKPYDFDMVIRKIRSALNGRARCRAALACALYE